MLGHGAEKKTSSQVLNVVRIQIVVFRCLGTGCLREHLAISWLLLSACAEICRRALCAFESVPLPLTDFRVCASRSAARADAAPRRSLQDFPEDQLP